jgi:hypothetical protein
VSVVSFTCRIGKKVLRGLVKEKFKAKQIFDEAVAKGETAGLLEQAPESSDVFSTKLGNIPPGQSVIVEITYIGELKHHETDGIRFTIPTSIAPRYGSGPYDTVSQVGRSVQDNRGIKISVDVTMPDGSFVKAVQSPSHPIAVSMGTVSTATNADPSMSKASASLSLGSAALEKDFVLIIQAKDIGIPKAILEMHPTIPNHRALMATLVPKFSLPPSRPEIVFVADRSGSMGGNIEMLVSAMKVFLKSMPVGVKFNICSFGSTCSFLWPKSKSYTAETLEESTNHLQTFQANMGGTETFEAIKATVDRRFADIPLEIVLLTDGDIWQQADLFAYVNQQVEQTNGKIRVFPLGIGYGVSHALIEGLARAGNGFAQAVQHGERLDSCVVRMLRGALSPHITNYTLEVKYDQEDEDFEVIENVTKGMKVLLSDSEKSIKSEHTNPKKQATISLFDHSASPEKEDVKGSGDPYAHLPKIPPPKLLQAPHKIPSLFAFSRTAIYLLMSPKTIQRNPTAVILRAISSHGPLALEIPVEILASPAETIHQLAAKKAVQDLEEGRGWIYDAKDQNGTLVKNRYPSCFDDLVQKEAVRLGEKFQVAGKWCSFVAVATNDKEIAAEEKQAPAARTDIEIDGKSPLPLLEPTYQTSAIITNPSLDADEDDHVDYSDEDFDTCDFDADTVRNATGHQEVYKPKLSYIQGFACRTASSTPAISQQQMQAQPNGSIPQNIPSRKCSTVLHSVQSQATPALQQLGQGVAFSFGDSSRIHSLNNQCTTPPPQHIDKSQQPMRQRQTAFGGRGGGPVGFGGRGGGSVRFGSSNVQYMTRNGVLTTSRCSLFGRNSPQSQTLPGSQNSSTGGFFGSALSSPPLLSNEPPPGALPYQSSGLFQSAFVTPGRSNVMYRQGSVVNAECKKASGSRSFDTEKDGAVDWVGDPIPDWSTKSAADKVLALISLQEFEGSWPADDKKVGEIMRFEIPKAPGGEELKVWVTLLVVKFLEEKCSGEEGTWGLVVEKARGWLEGLGFIEVESLEAAAGTFVRET